MTHWSFLSPLVLTLFLWKIFYGHLLTHEQQIKLHNIALDLSSSSVHMAQRHPSFSNNNSHGSNHASHGRGCSPHNNSFSQSNSSNWPLCQICGRVSHFSIKCYNRFNHSFQASSQGLASSFFLSFFFSSTPHVAFDSSWYHDTSSIHHSTNDLSNLNIHVDEYTVVDQIRVGNGKGSHISHPGLASIPSHNQNFSLKSLLHVPKIQNLIFVKNFTRENHVFIEFHPTCFCVKDLKSGRLVLQGLSNGGLYPWPSRLSCSTSPSALIGERVSIDQWHS
jgi:hypothetical protein